LIFIAPPHHTIFLGRRLFTMPTATCGMPKGAACPYVRQLWLVALICPGNARPAPDNRETDSVLVR
jgi:hypothetical protein